MNTSVRPPDGYLVIGSDGKRALFLDAGKAVEYAVKHHGIVQPLGPYKHEATS